MTRRKLYVSYVLVLKVAIYHSLHLEDRKKGLGQNFWSVRDFLTFGEICIYMYTYKSLSHGLQTEKRSIYNMNDDSFSRTFISKLTNQILFSVNRKFEGLPIFERQFLMVLFYMFGSYNIIFLIYSMQLTYIKLHKYPLTVLYVCIKCTYPLVVKHQ